MEKSRRTRNMPATAPTVAAAVALAIALVWVPAFFVFGVAIAAAVSWCMWLEEHPTLDIPAGPRQDRTTHLHAGR